MKRSLFLATLLTAAFGLTAANAQQDRADPNMQAPDFGGNQGTAEKPDREGAMDLAPDQDAPIDTGVDTGTAVGDVDTGTQGIDQPAPAQPAPTGTDVGTGVAPSTGAADTAAPTGGGNGADTKYTEELGRLEGLVNELEKVGATGDKKDKVGRNIKDMREKIADLRKKTEGGKEISARDAENFDKDLKKLKVKFADTVSLLPEEQRKALAEP